jgi:hypothetical protein
MAATLQGAEPDLDRDDGDTVRVPDRPEAFPDLFEHRPRRGRIALQIQPIANEVERERGQGLVSRGPSFTYRLLKQRPRLLVASLHHGGLAQADQRLGDATPVPQLLIQGMALPQEGEGRGDIALLARQQAGPEVVNLGRQPSLPGYGRRPIEVRRLGKG